jgi:hypothetical protein
MKKSTVTAIINALAEAEKYEAKVKITAGNKPFDISAISDLDTAFDTAIAAIVADLPDDADGGQAAAIVKAIALSEKHDSSVYVASDNKPFSMSAITDIDDAFDSAIEDVVDDVPEGGGGGGSDDYVTLDTEQTITGVKNFSDDGDIAARIGAGGMVEILSASDATISSFAMSNEYIYIYPNGSAGDELAFAFHHMPLNCTYSTANKTVDLTLGNGTKIRLSCTNVEEVSE